MRPALRLACAIAWLVPSLAHATKTITQTQISTSTEWGINAPDPAAADSVYIVQPFTGSTKSR